MPGPDETPTRSGDAGRPVTTRGVAARRVLEPPVRVPRGVSPDPAAGSGLSDQTASRAATLPPAVRTLWRVIAALLILGLVGFLIDGASRPRDPRLVPAPASATGGVGGMGSGTLSMAGSRAAPVCVLEAVTTAQQQRGLMGRTTVEPYSGMAFVFASPTTDRFWMKDTLIPLSIAWFDAAGRFESSAVMKPCPKTAASCPTYWPGRPYSMAVEVPAGRLKSLGIGPGSTAALGGPCS